MTGFSISEKMVGKHMFEPAWEIAWERNRTDCWRPMHFDAVWGTKDVGALLRDYLLYNQFLFELKGNITVDGLCNNVEITTGQLLLDYFNKHELGYEICFEVGDDEFYYVGKKFNIQLWNLLTSHTTCFGTIVDGDGNLVSTSVVYFELSSILNFVGSLKIF
jgi:hypothetical protein